DLGFCPVFPRQSHGDIRAHQQYRGALGSNARPHFESTSLPQRTPFIRIPVALVAHAGTWLTRALDSMLAPQGYRVLSVTTVLEEDTEPAGGLYTRRGLERRARELVSDAFRRHAPLACVAFSVEPESHDAPSGAAAASPVVVAFAARLLQASGRASDAIGRAAAGEFLVLAPSTAPEGAARMA